MIKLIEYQKDTIRKLFKVVPIIAVVVFVKKQTNCDNLTALRLIKGVIR